MKKAPYKNFFYVLLLIFFCFFFFVPRIFSMLRYEVLEDEILSIDNNIKYSATEFLYAPDFTHPGFWYILMELPTKILGINHGIFYYRLLQILILFSLVLFSLIYFRKKLNTSFLFFFFLIFFANTYLVHLTSQHRMYAMVIGIGVIYSFFWYFLIKRKAIISSKEAIYLGLIAALGFLTNYSIIWLIPIWPLAYFFYKKGKTTFKKILIFFSTILISISWFIPTFIGNAKLSVAANQWTPDFNFRNSFQVFGNHFGFLSKNLINNNEINLLSVLFLIIFLLIIIWGIFVEKRLYLMYLTFSTIIVILLFLLAVRLTGNSLLYARTTIPIVLVFYIILADVFTTENKLMKLLLTMMLFLQFSQFFIYFSTDLKRYNSYYLYDDMFNAVGIFRKFKFSKDSCLIAIPAWNTTSARFFLDDFVNVIPANTISIKEIYNRVENCPVVYVLDQNTIDRNLANMYYDAIFGKNYKLNFIESYYNQSLFIYKK